MILVRTPFRISLFGGSSDYADYFSQKREVILIGFAIDKYCYTGIKLLPRLFDYKTVCQYSTVEKVNDHNEIRHNGIRGVLEYLKINCGLDIVHMSDLPGKTGIGSSSSFIVGLLNGLIKLCDLPLKTDKQSLAEHAIHVERFLLKESGGIQDQIWASFGGVNSIHIEQSGRFFTKPLPVSQQFLTTLQERSVLFYTGQARNSFEIAKSHENVNKDGIQAIARRAYFHFLNEDICDIGEELNLAWKEKRAISTKISSAFIDEFYSFCMENGGIGGKLLGAGGSGFVYIILDKETDKEKFLRAVRNRYRVTEIPFNYDYNGTTIIQQ